MARNWSDGDVLSKEGLNELTQSINLRFPTAAVRDATLVGDIAPVPGMVVTLTDTNITWIYIVVGGIGYWAPQPGTLCFNNYQTVQQSSFNFKPINNLTASAQNMGRNLGGWLNTATGIFTPLCPGYYEFSGAISKAGAAAAQYMHPGVSFNGAPSPLNASCGGSAGLVAGSNWVLPMRRFFYYMNGTTDYASLVLYSDNTGTTNVNTRYQCSFAAKYMGW